jgi:hypothetical protein
MFENFLKVDNVWLGSLWPKHLVCRNGFASLVLFPHVTMWEGVYLEWFVGVYRRHQFDWIRNKKRERKWRKSRLATNYFDPLDLQSECTNNNRWVIVGSRPEWAFTNAKLLHRFPSIYLWFCGTRINVFQTAIV